MDVHKPRFVANWRELLKEWGIIVLGVLTALLAEQGVQSIDWRHKVHVADAEMSNELSSGDGPQAYVRVAIHDCVAANLDAIRSAVERGNRTSSAALIDRLWLPNRTWDSLAREAATASDVTSHMPHQKLFQFRVAYEILSPMERIAEQELTDRAALRGLPAAGGPLETDEKMAALRAVEGLRIDNDTIDRESQFLLRHIRMIGLKLESSFVRSQMTEAQQHFGKCLSGPPRVVSRT
jgi:hypothetical protein